MKVRGSKIWAVLVVIALIVAVGACAKQAAPPQEKYPSRPIKVILTHGVGGSVDTQARLIAPYVEKYLGASLALENMEGAGGRKARAFVYKAEPDGYTLMVTGFPSTVVGELLYEGDYKTTDFTFIHSFMGKDYSLVAVSTKSPFQSYKELVEQSKKKPLKVGTAGTGTTDHLTAVMLKHYTGLQYELVPFDSTADSMMALLGGKIDAIMDAVSTTAVRSDLRALVVTAPERSEYLPDVPTLAEQGFESLDVQYALGFVAPPGLAEEKRKILEDAVAKAVADPEYQSKLKQAKSLPLPLKGAEFKKMVEDLYKRTQEVLPLLQADIKK